MNSALAGVAWKKEIIRQAASVFELDIPKIMTYVTVRLFVWVVKGILYILIETFCPQVNCL